MYALNLDKETGRILSATYPEYAPVDAIIVSALPEGNIADYLYVDNEYVYDPLSKVEPEVPTVPTTEARLTALEEKTAVLEEAMLEDKEALNILLGES